MTEPGVRTELDWRRAVLALAAGFALWLLMRPYYGLIGDSRLYLGQALASLHPASIGQDALFSQDGQFDFTLYPLLTRGLVAAIGAPGGAMVLSLAGLGLWFAGLVTLARRLTRGAGWWLAAAAVILLPGVYDGLSAFHIGEALATPRVFAEAACLFAFAALLARRTIAAFLLLALGFGFHPIMALGAAGCVIIYLCLADRRWLWLVAAGMAGLALALAFHLPLADRLLTSIPGPWRQVIVARSDIILPSRWPLEFWGVQVVHLVTIALAARRSEAPTARLLWAVVLASLAGVAVAWTLGDRWPLLLVMQVQAWRILWVTTLFAAASLGLLGLARRAEGPPTLALPLLIGVWVVAETPAIALPALALAVFIQVREDRGLLEVRPGLVRAAWIVVLGLISIQLVMTVVAVMRLSAARPAGAEIPFQAWEAVIDCGGLALACAVLSRTRWPRPGLGLTALGSLALLVCAGLHWDQRTSAQRDLEQPANGAALKRVVAARPGAVLWADGDIEPWLWLDRPSWTSSLHGAGVVFSRPLALEWDRRMQAAIAAGLMSPAARTPFHQTPTRAIDPTPDRISAFCAAPGAPAWIVTPRRRNDPLAPIALASWRPPHPTWRLSFTGRVLSWRGGSDLLAIACGAGARPTEDRIRR